MFEAYVKKMLASRVYDLAIETTTTFAPKPSKKLGIRVSLKREKKIKGHSITDLTKNEAASVHLSHMFRGKPKNPISGAVFRFKFPERKGALLKFLNNIGTEWDRILFHYRNHGSAWDRVLVGFAVQGKSINSLREHLMKGGLSVLGRDRE